MYPAANTTLGSATAASNKKSSSFVEAVRFFESRLAKMKPPTTVTEAVIAP